MELSPAKKALMEKWLQGKAASKRTEGIPKRPAGSPVPLSFPQQRQLFLELLDRGTAVNNLSVLIELKGELNKEVLENSANEILKRHEALRTQFSLGMGLPETEILESLTLTIPQVELTDDLTRKQEEARRLAEEEVLIPFDLAQAPLIRLKLYALSPQEHWLLVVVHHTIADGWSLGVFLKELSAFYKAAITGSAASLPELSIQYADYVHWQLEEMKKPAMNASLAYWKEQLAGELPTLELPTDQPRSSRQSFNGGSHRFMLSAEDTMALEKLSREEDATLFMSLLSLLSFVLHRFSGQEEVIIGTPVASRSQQELESLIGVFINTLAIRTGLNGNPTFRELLQRIRKTSLDAFSHQAYPFEKLVEALKPKRDLSRTPIFQVVFNLQSAPMPELDMPGLSLRFPDFDRGTSQFDLTLMMTRMGDQYQASVEYNSDLFEAESISLLFDAFNRLLKGALARPDEPLSETLLVTKEEQEEVLTVLNDTEKKFPLNRSFHQLLEEQVRETPDAIAVIYEDRQLSYKTLNEQANQLAHKLRELGVGSGTRVGILMNRSERMLVSLLAVQKSGGTYVPIHTAFPTERIQFILEDASMEVLLTDVDTDKLSTAALKVLYPTDLKAFSQYGQDNPELEIGPDDLAYIIYTSGSTGQPKGVMIPHSALTNFLCSMQQQPGMTAKDVLMAVTSVSFDISALELYLPLMCGASVVIASEAMLQNPILLGEAIEQQYITVMQATPATWQLLLESDWQGNQRLKALCGGEALSRRLANRLLNKVGSLWNMYGPTETTIWSACCPVDKEDAPIVIGKPIANTELYVLDSYGQSVPKGVTGELWIGGAGLATGYLNRAGLTAEKFVFNHLNPVASNRLYRTGDHARYLKNYSIEVLGRTDHQVKIQGHRIELGEISTALTQHPSVADAVVISRTENSGYKRLVAYYIPEKTVEFDAANLRDFLKTKLPAYMIPSFFVEMETFPLSTSGKVDRKALPLPEDNRELDEYVAPGSESEEILVKIWENILEIEQVGVEDNFFDLGGASIQSLQIVAKANMYGLPLNVENIFEYQTIRELVRFLQEDSGKS
ncbi:MAG: hypothetical protein Roseis2KO_04020 [Roseivirga sp.]